MNNNKGSNKYFRLILFFSIAILFFLLISRYENDKKILEQNIFALNDSIRITKVNDSITKYEKGILISTKEELERRNKNLSDEVVFWKNKKSKVEYITETNIEYNKPKFSISNDLVTYNDSTFGLKFRRVESNYSLVGTSKFSLNIINDSNLKINPLETVIDTNIFKIDLITGIKTNKDGFKEIFVSTKDPNIKINSIEGHILKDNTNKNVFSKFSIGPSVGFGLIMPLNGALNLGFYGGIAVSYKIF